MSEELRSKGYIDRRGRAHGDAIGHYEGFNIGATTFAQLRAASIIPKRDYGKRDKNKPDGLIVDRRLDAPVIKLLVEHKDIGGLDSNKKLRDFADKVSNEYCRPLECQFAAITDSRRTSWIMVGDDGWQFIRREDDYPLDTNVDLSSKAGRELISRTINRLELELDKSRAVLRTPQSVNPTRLAEQTWQTIWLASGEKAEECLATFIEILIFKFLSDLGILREDSTGASVDFKKVLSLERDKALKYYFKHVRPEIKRLFPSGNDGTSIINGIVLDPRSKEHGWLFLQILNEFEQEFNSIGPIKRLHPEFKSRIFERFLKKEQTVRYWGQYFTPRNVVKAMVEMSDIEHLPPNSVVCDPACGVGGFLLEPLIHKRPFDFRFAGAPTLRYVGWERDNKLSILAKANMLVHLSEIFADDPVGAVEFLAPILNQTFEYVGAEAITGSLAKAPREEFDLVLTNPPYVVKGAGVQREALHQESELGDYYSISGSGVENLFLQLIINGLKPGGRALVIVPDGLLLRHTEGALKQELLDSCDLEAIISLPKNTFYSTPKKTYILAFRKKQTRLSRQKTPVFTYLATNIGETRDKKRFTVEQNDLIEMATQFRLFAGNPAAYSPDSPRIKLWSLSQFDAKEHWLIEKWWSREERESLGDLEEEVFIGTADLSAMLRELSVVADGLADGLAALEVPESPNNMATLSLSDTSLFRMSIGKRVIRKDLFYSQKGDIPLYSANVERGKEHGWITNSNLKDFSTPSLLWSIDSDFNMTVRDANETFATTDHCGRIEILHPDLDPSYCRAAITYGFGRAFGFDRVHRPSLKRMKKVTFPIPVNENGEFDVDMQREMANIFELSNSALSQVADRATALEVLKPKLEFGSV